MLKTWRHIYFRIFIFLFTIIAKSMQLFFLKIFYAQNKNPIRQNICDTFHPRHLQSIPEPPEWQNQHGAPEDHPSIAADVSVGQHSSVSRPKKCTHRYGEEQRE